jgi:hypothetical protein
MKNKSTTVCTSANWLKRSASTITSCLLLIIAACAFSSAWAQNIPPSGSVSNRVEPGATALLQKREALSSQLAQNAFGRPIYIESAETSGMVNGNAYAILDAPFATVSATLKSPARWCDVMILHINTKFCRASMDSASPVLSVNVGKKTAQDLSDTFAITFAFHQMSGTPDYLAVQLNAEEGPLGTENYRIELRAVPLPGGKTFMHLRYSYEYGMAGRIAMQGYLATVGSRKVGFTRSDDGKKQGYIGGMRGAVERNTMRYYLAIDAYLDSLSAPASQQVNKRLEQWFKATEQYPEQLHEMDLATYLTLKKAEVKRQQTGT